MSHDVQAVVVVFAFTSSWISSSLRLAVGADVAGFGRMDMSKIATVYTRELNV